jgi:hypothetical protein
MRSSSYTYARTRTRTPTTATVSSMTATGRAKTPPQSTAPHLARRVRVVHRDDAEAKEARRVRYTQLLQVLVQRRGSVHRRLALHELQPRVGQAQHRHLDVMHVHERDLRHTVPSNKHGFNVACEPHVHSSHLALWIRVLCAQRPGKHAARAQVSIAYQRSADAVTHTPL